MKERFVNPFTDFGFKRLFGEEASKEILIDFLNELLREEEGSIKSLTFMRNEQLGSLDRDRRAIFDLYCENERGEKFIVEMQKAKQNFFPEHFAKKGDWDYQLPGGQQARSNNLPQEWGNTAASKLKAVYTIGLLDFVFSEDKDDKNKFFYRVKLSDIDTNKVFYKKLTFLYLEMPKFNKSLEECNTHFDKWLYLLKNLTFLERIPDALQEKIFQNFFGKAEIANFNRDELLKYAEDLKVYRDMKGILDSAKEEGLSKGVAIGRAEQYELRVASVKKMFTKGMSATEISELTGFSEEEIRKMI